MNIADQMRQKTKEAEASRKEFLGLLTEDVFDFVMNRVIAAADRGIYSIFINHDDLSPRYGLKEDEFKIKNVTFTDMTLHIRKRLEADGFYVIGRMDGFKVDWQERVLIPRSLEAPRVMDASFNDKW